MFERVRDLMAFGTPSETVDAVKTSLEIADLLQYSRAIVGRSRERNRKQ